MCFSAAASLATGVALLPAGAYCLQAAVRKNRTYLPLAVTPLLFGVQQLCEAGVWLGLHHDDPGLVKPSALGFLFFAYAFWPFWVPFIAWVIEVQKPKRRLFAALAVVGLGLGGTSYVPAAANYDTTVIVRHVDHSIQYDLTELPLAREVAGTVWLALYMAAVCCPLLLSSERRLPLLGVSITVAAVVTHVMFRYAFASVWCFFAALLSLHLCYVLYRLPARSDNEMARR